MSEVTVTPIAAPINVDPAKPTPPAAAAPAAAAPAAPAGDPENPQWLGARLERERAKLLKDLGLENVEDGKKAIADLNAKREAEKSATQKATELEGSLKSTKAERDAMAATLSDYAKTQLEALTPEQRKTVTDIAGDDAAKQLQVIKASMPTWKASAPTTTEKPADTAPTAKAPDATSPNLSPPDPRAVYAELKKTNPVIAARYALANNVHST